MISCRLPFCKITLMTILLLLVSCNSSRKENSSSNNIAIICIPELIYSGDEFIIDAKDSLTHKLNVIIDGYSSREEFSGRYQSSIRSIIRNGYGLSYNLGLKIHDGSETFPVRFMIDDFLDTLVYFNYSKRISQNNELYAEQVSGNLAPIVSEGEINISESDVRKWLYDIHRPLNNSEILGLISIIEDLSSYDTYAYKQKDGTKLNVVKTFEGIKYRIKSNLTADYYYLFAAKSDSDISEFIKEVISNNFPYATHSLSQTVNCFRKASKYDFMNSGLNTVFLIGINSDWSSAVIPVGLVLVDVSAPSIITENDHLFRTHSSLTSNHGVKQYKPISSNSDIFPKHYLSYKKYNLEILDQNESATSGTVYLSTEPFNGNFPKSCVSGKSSGRFI